MSEQISDSREVGTQALRLSTNEVVTILSGPYPDEWGAYYECRTADGVEHLRAHWLASEDKPSQ